MRRTLIDVTVLVSAGVLVWLAFGRPDPVTAIGLVRATDPSRGQVIAGVGLLAWALIGGMSSVVIVRVARRAGPWSRAVAILLLGAMLLSVGMAVHHHGGFNVCCGSVQSAQRALGDAP